MKINYIFGYKFGLLKYFFGPLTTPLFFRCVDDGGDGTQNARGEYWIYLFRTAITEMLIVAIKCGFKWTIRGYNVCHVLLTLGNQPEIYQVTLLIIDIHITQHYNLVTNKV